MKKFVVTTVLGVVVAILSLPAISTPVQAAQASYGCQVGQDWCVVGPYHCYDAAYRKACQLERYGYDTQIVRRNSCYYVYYR